MIQHKLSNFEPQPWHSFCYLLTIFSQFEHFFSAPCDSFSSSWVGKKTKFSKVWMLTSFMVKWTTTFTDILFKKQKRLRYLWCGYSGPDFSQVKSISQATMDIFSKTWKHRLSSWPNSMRKYWVIQWSQSFPCTTMRQSIHD